MQFPIFGVHLDNQPKDQTVESAPSTEQASWGNSGTDMELPIFHSQYYK